jgi:hypothetical protein
VKLEAATLWNRRKFIKLAMAGLVGGTGIYALLNNYRKNNVLDIVAYPDPALRKVSTPIDRIDDAVISMANAMIDTLRFKAPFEFFLHASIYKGLSAPQIGIQKRLIVCGLYGETRAIVNPVILEKKGSPLCWSTRSTTSTECSISITHKPVESSDALYKGDVVDKRHKLS